MLEDVYNSRFVDTAVGASLLNLGRAIGLRVLSAQKATGYLTVTGPPGTIIPEGWLAETAAGIQFFAVAETEIKADGTALVPARCTNTGPEGNVEAGTVTTITNPGAIAGITGVTNAAAFTGGRERETDDEFRDRYYASVDFAGGVNADSIRAALLQEVEAVSYTHLDVYKRQEYGIMLDETALKQSAAALGLGENIDSLDDAAAAQVRLNAILMQSEAIQEAAITQTDGLVNSTKSLKGIFNDFLSTAGSKFAPAVETVVDSVVDSWPTLEPMLLSFVDVLADGLAGVAPVLVELCLLYTSRCV